MAAVISPAMARHNARIARAERIAISRAVGVPKCDFLVVDADSGVVVHELHGFRLEAERFASDRSHGDRSLVVVKL